MKNFSKLLLGILATICCNSINATENLFPNNNTNISTINTNEIIKCAVDNNISTTNTNEIIQYAVDTTIAVQKDLNLHNNINLLIQCFDPSDLFTIQSEFMNPQYSKINIYSDRKKASRIAIIKSLLYQKINVSVETEDKVDDIFDKLYNNNLKNALQQNNKDEVIKILTYSNERTIRIKNEMQNNIKVIQNMPQDYKKMLKYSLSSDLFRDIVGYINKCISFCQDRCKELNSISFYNNAEIELFRNKILEIISNVLDFLKAEKQCFQELGIDPATI